MDDEKLAELGKYRDEYLTGDPKASETKQAKFLFDNMAKALYATEPETYRKAVTLESFIATRLNPEISAFQKRSQTKYPTIMPEKV